MWLAWFSPKNKDKQLVSNFFCFHSLPHSPLLVNMRGVRSLLDIYIFFFRLNPCINMRVFLPVFFWDKKVGWHKKLNTNYHREHTKIKRYISWRHGTQLSIYHEGGHDREDISTNTLFLLFLLQPSNGLWVLDWHYQLSKIYWQHLSADSRHKKEDAFGYIIESNFLF